MKRKSGFMKNILIAVFILIASIRLHAQYYYNDIIGTRNLNQTIQLYQDNKVISAAASGYDNNGVKNDVFSETYHFYPDQKFLKIYTRNKRDTSTEYDYFNSKNFVTTISDTTASFISTTTYTYDDKNNPIKIENMVSDPNDSVYAKEVHQWFYNADGKPVRMLRVVNKNDTTDIHFTLDDKGNVIEELPSIHKINREKTYYYYDDKNRLTDIVRYNIKAQRFLPDYMFEYSDKDEVIQKITTLSSEGIGYIIWRYVYNDMGLKTTEANFNRNKELMGKIKYIYQLGQ
jgi:hypothetical protein